MVGGIKNLGLAYYDLGFSLVSILGDLAVNVCAALAAPARARAAQAIPWILETVRRGRVRKACGS